MELGLGHGKSRKMNQMVAAFLTSIHTLSSSTVRIGSICCLVDLVHVYENPTCLICTRLNSPGKTWKMDINSLGKSLKKQFQCSIRTL